MKPSRDEFAALQAALIAGGARTGAVELGRLAKAAWDIVAPIVRSRVRLEIAEQLIRDARVLTDRAEEAPWSRDGELAAARALGFQEAARGLLLDETLPPGRN